MLQTAILEATGSPQALVFALHGRGANLHDLVPLAEALSLPEVRYVFAQAPMPVPDYVGGWQWYEFGPEHAQGVEHSAGLLTELVHSERRHFPLSYALVGFSQGAVMALSTGLLLNPAPAAIAALSGYLFEPEIIWSKRPAGQTFPEVLVIHGSADPVIPVRAGQKAAAGLRQAGVNVDYREYPMGHQINAEALADLRAFLVRTLALSS